MFQAKRDLAFLFKLAMECNNLWFEKERALTLGYALLVAKLGRLLDREPATRTKQQGPGGEHYLRMAAVLVELADAFQREALLLDAAFRPVSEQYFGGAPVLWPDSVAAVAQSLREFAQVAALYNDAVAEAPALRKQRQRQVLTAEALSDVSGKAAATMRVYLVDPAKAETLRLMDEDNQAADVMAKYAG